MSNLVNTNDSLPIETVSEISSYKFNPNNVVDLHKKGIHFWDSKLLPSFIDPVTFASYHHRGLTSPVSLPSFFPDNQADITKEWLSKNFFNLFMGGIDYLGNEANLQRAEDFEKSKTRILFVRLTHYYTAEGSVTFPLLSNFIQDFTDDVFVDYAYPPYTSNMGKIINAGLPMLIPIITKRPVHQFDIICISWSFTTEVFNLPALLARSGIPLHLWERQDESLPYKNYRNGRGCPLILLGGVNGLYVNKLASSNPLHGNNMNSFVDLQNIGEGCMQLTKFVQAYQDYVQDKGYSHKKFCEEVLNNHEFKGTYYPPNLLYEYYDKEVKYRDYKNNDLGSDLYECGGPIKRISLLNHKDKEKVVIAGKENELFAELQPIQDEYQKIQDMSQDELVSFANRYIKSYRAKHPEEQF